MENNQNNQNAQNKAMEAAQNRMIVTSDDPIVGMLWDTAKFEHLQRLANMFANSGMVPDLFKKNPAACAVGLQLAQQLQVAPFMLFQKMYTIGGKPAIEAQLAIAVANQRGVFTGPIEYTFVGENKDKTRACTAKAVLSKTKTPVEMTIDWAVVDGEGWSKKGGSKWLTMPDQMFRYRSAMWLIRTYCPEVLFGMYSTEELDDMRTIDITPNKPASPMKEALRTGADFNIGESKPDTSTEDAKFTEQGNENNLNAEPTIAEIGDENAIKDSIPQNDQEFNVAFAESVINELIVDAGLDSEKKQASLDIIFKTATGGKSRNEWGASEYQTLEKTLKSIIEKNAKLAALKAQTAKKE